MIITSREISHPDFSKAIEFSSINTSEVKLVESGKYKGFMHGRSQFVANAKQIAISVYCKTKAIISEFFNMFRNSFSSPSFRNESLQNRINRIRGELKKKYNLSDDDLIIEFEDQFGEIHIVVIKKVRGIS